MQIRTTQLQAGMIIQASYNRYNQGCDDYEFLGFTDHTVKYGGNLDGTPPVVAFKSTKELLDHYHVKGLRALEDLQANNKYGFQSYMVVRDLETGKTGAWFYLYEGRWSRGSGAEPLSFELLTDKTPPELIPAPKPPRTKKPAQPKADTQPIQPKADAKPVVRLIGEDGNVFNIIGRVSRALKPIGKDVEFRSKAFAAKSYDEVLCLAMNYCDVE